MDSQIGITELNKIIKNNTNPTLDDVKNFAKMIEQTHILYSHSYQLKELLIYYSKWIQQVKS